MAIATKLNGNILEVDMDSDTTSTWKWNDSSSWSDSNSTNVTGFSSLSRANLAVDGFSIHAGSTGDVLYMRDGDTAGPLTAAWTPLTNFNPQFMTFQMKTSKIYILS